MSRTLHELVKILKFRSGLGQCWLAWGTSGGAALIVPSALPTYGYALLRVWRDSTLEAALAGELITLGRLEPLPDFEGDRSPEHVHFTHGFRVGLPEGGAK